DSLVGPPLRRLARRKHAVSLMQLEVPAQPDHPRREVRRGAVGDAAIFEYTMVNFADAAATRRKTFCGPVMKVVEELKIQRVALFGAFLAEVLYTDPVPLTGFASDPAILERLKVSSTAY